jgi:hypothetical protein
MPNLHGCALGLCSNAAWLLFADILAVLRAQALRHSSATGTPTLGELHRHPAIIHTMRSLGGKVHMPEIGHGADLGCSRLNRIYLQVLETAATRFQNGLILRKTAAFFVSVIAGRDGECRLPDVVNIYTLASSKPVLFGRLNLR